MRSFSIAAAVAVSTIAFAQAASAADLPVKTRAVPVTAPYTWTGFYVGGNVGGGWGSQDIKGYTPNDPAMLGWFRAFGPPPSVSLNASSALGGLQLGYNWQFRRNWLVSLEADLDWSDFEGSGAVNSIFGGGGNVPFQVTADERVKWFGTVRARLGYLPIESLLAYITGGFAFGRVQHDATYVNTSGNTFISISVPYSFRCTPGQTCFAGSLSGTATGWTLGGGLEYALGQSWTLRGEYLYVSLGSKSVTETASTVFAAGNLPASFNVDFSRTNFNVARIALNYRF